MYRIFKPKGSLSNITITNEETTSSVILGRYGTTYESIFYKYGIAIPSSTEEWSFEVKDEVGKELAMVGFTGHKPTRTKIQKNEQEVKDLFPNVKSTKKYSAYDFLFGHTDELDDED